MSTASLDEKIGADAAMFIMFLWYCCATYAILAFLSLVILIPINATGGGGQEGLNSLNIGNVLRGSPKFWAHSVFAWVVSFLIYYLIKKMNHTYKKYRYRHFLRQADSHNLTARTVVVRNIPPEDRDDAKMENFFKNLQVGQVVDCKVYQKYEKLKEMSDEYEKYLRCYESELVKLDELYKKKEDFFEMSVDRTKSLWELIDENPAIISSINPKYVPKTRLGRIPCVGKEVNALNYYATKCSVLKHRLEERKRDYMSDQHATQTAFVTYEDAKSAHIVAQSYISTDELAYSTELAPEPREVFWENLDVPHLASSIAKAVSNIGAFVLTLFYLIPVAFIVSLTSIQQISAASPALAQFLESNPFVKSLLVSVVPTVLTSVLMSLSPVVLGLFTSVEKPISMSEWERRTTNKYFVFILFNVLLVFTLGGTAIKSAQEIIENPTAIVSILSTQLPQNANFFIYYVILSCADFAFALLQIGRLIFYSLRKILYKTPRQQADFFKPDAFSYHTSIPPVCLILVTAIAYSCIAPLISVFACIYFFLQYFGFKYQLLYVNFPAYESGGIFYRSIFGFIITGLVIFQLTMLGQLSLLGAVGPSIFIVPLLFFTAYVWYSTNVTVFPRTQFLPLMEFNRAAFDDYEVESDDAILPQNLNARTSFKSLQKLTGIVSPGKRLNLKSDVKSPVSANASLSRVAVYNEDQNALNEENVKEYYYNVPPYSKYENPVIGEKMKSLWLPPQMNVVRRSSIDWSLAHSRSMSRQSHKPEEQEMDSPISPKSEDNLV